MMNILDGDSFGELAALGIEKFRLITVKADTYCEMNSLEREDLMDAFSRCESKMFPHLLC
jgi:hypothetical protein